MLVERKSRHGQRVSRSNEGINLGKGTVGSRFLPLNVEVDLDYEISGAAGEILEKEGTVCAARKMSNSEDRDISKGGSGRASFKGFLGQVGEVAHGTGVGFMPLVGPILGTILIGLKCCDDRSEGGPILSLWGKGLWSQIGFPKKTRTWLTIFSFLILIFFFHLQVHRKI